MITYHDYKCELKTLCDNARIIDVYEDADFVARFVVKGFFHKHLKLIQTKRLIKDIGLAAKHANLFFNSIKHSIK